MQWAAKLSNFSLRVSLPLTVVALLMLASDGWCQQELRSGKKGATSPAPVTSTSVDADTQALDVAIKAGSITLSGADGATLDGANSAIRATVFDRTNSNPVATQLVDSNGDPVSVGGGTQYSQGTAATDTDQLMLAGCVRADTAAVPTGVIDGDRVRCIVDSAGLLWVRAAQSGTWNIGTLTSITNAVAVTGTFWQATQPISAASLPLPTGAATAANQDGIIRDGTGDTTQANVVSGRLQVDGSGVTQPVSGTVTVTDGAGALNVICDSGCGGGTQYAEDTAHVSGDQLSMAGVVQQTADAALAADGDRTALQVDANGYLKVNIKAGAGSGGTAATDNSAFTGGTTSVTPIGAIYDTTPPAVTDGNVGAPRMDSNRYLYVDCVVGCSGGATTPTDNFANPTDAGNSAAFNFVWDGAAWDRAPGTSTDGLLVNLGANNDVTVTGSVTANAGTNLNTSLLALESGGNLATIAGVVDATASTVPANALVVGGTDGTNTRMLKTDTAGELQVDVLTLPALPAGANTIGTVNIGTFPDNEPINVAQMNGVAVTMGNGVAGTGVQRVTIASDSTGTLAVTQATASSLNAQVVGSVAHDGVDAGNPVKIGCHARTTNRTAVADADRADVVCDDNGQLVVTPMAPRDRVVRSGVVTVSTTTETTLLAAGGAGVFRDLTYLKCTNNSATLVRVDLRDATAGTVIDSWALAASGGGFNLAFSVPYAQASANNNWTIQLSGAVTDVRCSCQAVEKN